MIDLLEKWQTLAGSFLAIGAAFIGGYFIKRQIYQADALEQRRLDRRLLAARATPLTLSAIAAWARPSGASLQDALSLCRGDSLPRSASPAPLPASPETIAALERIVEAAGSAAATLAIAELLSKVRVFTARTSDLPDRGAHRVMMRLDPKVLVALVERAPNLVCQRFG